MKIGYDIDGCVVNSAPFFTMDVSKKYGVLPGKLRQFDDDGNELFLFNLPEGFTDWDGLKNTIADSIAFWHPAMSPVQGAIHTIYKIYAMTLQSPVFLTARDNRTLGPFEEWLKDPVDFRLPYNLTRVEQHADKQHVVESMGITHYVEDRYRTACELAALGLRVYLIDAPYNRRDLPRNVTRCYTWDDVYFNFQIEWDEHYNNNVLTDMNLNL